MSSKLSAYNIFLHVALVALATLTLVLAAENRALKKPTPTPANGPDLGQSVGELAWSPLDTPETTTQLADAGKESLLFIFTTDCAACQATQPVWKTLHQTMGDSVNVIGISLSDADPTRTYRNTHSLPFPVGLPADTAAFMESFAVTGVPLTVRVGANGRVVGTWSGTLSEGQRSEIAATIG
ncbi:MAG: TlpA disulfide reductase family protein [Acidobacteriota bacterium]